MANIWQKKLQALNERKESKPIAPQSAAYWRKKLSDLEEKNKPGVFDGWFQAPLFKDGYDVGDVTRTILGTGKDIADNLAAAHVDAAENIIDTAATTFAAPLFSETPKGVLFWNEKDRQTARDNISAFVAKDLLKPEETGKVISTFLSPISAASAALESSADAVESLKNPGKEKFSMESVMDTMNADDTSVLGEKTDSLIQSGTHLAGSLAAQAGGVPTWLTMGINAYGSEVEQAFQNDATYGEALASGAVSAVSEVVFEKLVGGIVSKTGLDDVILKPILHKIKSKVAQSFLKFGWKGFGEILEEEAQELIGNLTKKLTYEDDKTWKEAFLSEEALEGYLDAAIGALALSSAGQGVEIAGAKATGKDYVSGLTKNEQKVFDKVYEDKLAEAAKDKKDGKVKLRDQRKIYDEVIKQMQRGEISTDTIEEVLGGERYKNYKTTVDSEDAKIKQLKDQLAELGKQPNSVENTKKYDALDSRIKEMQDKSERNKLHNELSNEVFGIVKDSRLAESYNQKAQRGQHFRADVSKYNDKQKKVVQAAMDSGVLNNTRRTHEFVDFIAKLSEKINVDFDFTSNEKLKDTIYSVEGATVNGYFDRAKGSIGININSAKALNSVVGHEITHVLEGTEFYDALKNTVVKYAQSKGDYDGRLETLKKLYKEDDIDSEMVADLVGDYLFTDSDFVNRITAENRPLAQKLLDQVKYMCKIATAGSKEARQLEKIKKTFEDAFKQERKTPSKGTVQNSLTDSDGNQLTQAQQEFFKDSKVRDADGNLLVLYHGTSKGGFFVFDTYGSNYGLFGQGSYFTDNKDVAETYTNKGRGNSKQIYKTYLNIKNPMDMDAQADPKQWAAAFEDVDFPDSGTNEQFYRAVEEFYADQYLPKWEVAEIIQETIQYGMGYDGLTHIGGGRVNADGVRHRVYIAFESNQIKSVTNENPTSDPDIRYSLSSMGTTFFGNENMSVEEFTAEDYKRTTGYQNYVNECLNNYRQTRGADFDEATARKEIEDGIDGIVKVAIAAKKAGYDIFDDGARRDKKDSKNRLLFSSLEPNSDYFTSSDISTICDKRKNFAQIYDDIVKAEEANGVPQGKRFFDNVDNYFYIHGILAEKGLTQPCRQCYVESMRKNLAPMASAFLRLVNETDANNTANDQLYQQKGKNKGTLKINNAALRERVLEILSEYEMSPGDLTTEMLTTADGLAELKITAPLVYEAFNSFYGQSKPKMPKAATPFRFGELTALLTDEKGRIKQSVVDKINATGGFRLQSYSDFQIQNYTDVLQVIFEAGTLGLNGHAYTKVPAFLEATEGTNLKRNISIFMYKDGNEWKLDRNDSFPYSLEEIYDIVRADESGNTGIIAVSQNDDMSAWIMANDMIAYGIPFHKSGLKMGTVRDTDVKTDDGRIIKGYSGTKDHTRQQTEVWATNTADHKALTKVKHGINIYDFWDFDNQGNLSKNELIEKNVKRYIDECEKAGYLPKFRDYVMNNGKVLNNILTYAKEFGYVSQDATINDIAFQYKGYTIPYGYYKFLGDFGMFTPDGKASPHETLSLNNYDFDKAVRFFEDSETLRRNEILQQFANDGERQKYAEQNLNAGELLDIIKQKRASVVNDVLNRSLSKPGEQTKTYGNYNITGEDVALAPVKKPIAPVSQTTAQATAPVSQTNIAPIAKNANIAPMPDSSVGAAASGFDPLTHLQYEYGTLPEGENPVRDDSLPKSTTGEDKVSLTARTVKGAQATPDELVDLLDKETVGGRFSYIPITNSETVTKAYNDIVKKGWEAARGEWEARVRRGEVSAELTATGSLLLNNAAKAGDRKAWLSVLHDYQLMGTNAGQAVQAMRILKTLTPDDSLYMIERSVEQMVEDMKPGTEIKIDETLKKNYLDAKTDAEKESARKAIAKNVAKQIKPTILDMWTALRYMNMLGNLRTQSRNIFGNMGMAVTQSAKNAIATSMEAFAHTVSGGKFRRTKSLFVNKDQLRAAREDFANVKHIALNGGKYNDPMSQSAQFEQEVQDSRTIFRGVLAPLEWYRKGTNLAMDTGDLVFSKAAYARALAGYLKANGIKETDFSKIDQQTLDAARTYAINEARETTFRDNNWLSSWVSKIGRRKDTPKFIKTLSEGVMPFRKTPANILLRAEEYSPLGLINATVNSIRAAKNPSEITGADVVNSWAKALTGTGLFAMGMLLSNSGMLSGGADEDEDKEWFEDQYGWQNYALHIGDYNFTIDFLAPAAMPLLMGAQLNKLMQDGDIELKDLETALLSIADPMIEMSMLQGVNDTLENIQYAESNMGQFLINAALSYLTQGLTNSFAGQIERSLEGQRMTTFVDKDSSMPAWLQKAIGKASAKFPGLDYQQIPYIDAWGETENIAPLPALAENTLSPSYIEKGVSDFVYEELNRLNDAQSDINVYPQTPDKTVSFVDADGNRHENYNLSADEYVELAKLQGQTQKALVEEILSNDRYEDLTDPEKAKAIQLAYQYAREFSRTEVLGADGFSSKWMGDADDVVDAIISHTSEEKTYAYQNPDNYAIAKAVGGYEAYTGYSKALSGIEADKDKNGKKITNSRKTKVFQYINGLDISRGEKLILFKKEYPGDDTYNREIVSYIKNRSDISAADKNAILKELGFMK